LSLNNVVFSRIQGNTCKMWFRWISFFHSSRPTGARSTLIQTRSIFPKTKNGEPRSIPLNADLLAALDRLRQRNAHAKRIFLTADGKPFIKKALRSWFDDAVVEAGIENFHWHDLRHTFCSRLVMAGVPLKVVQELAGHKTIQMTARYSHLAPGHQRSAVDLIATANSHQRPGYVSSENKSHQNSHRQ
jgi:integrase